MMFELGQIQDLRTSNEHEAWWKGNWFLIVSYPRSGSHWVRRMLGEITVMRSGFKSARFGRGLDRVAGWQPPAENDATCNSWKTPFFTATHSYVDHCQLYLRRNFTDVYASHLKAMAELPRWAWEGTDEQMYAKWFRHVEHHASVADVVLDYEVIRADPEIAVRVVGRMAGLNLTEREIRKAVKAGSRKNMLREQGRSNAVWTVINKEKVA